MWLFNKTKQNNVTVFNEQIQKQASYYDKIINTIFRTLSRRRGSGGTFGISPDGTRNYNELFGYGEFLTFTKFLAMYKRGGIASVIVSKVAKLCWRDMPEIKVKDKNVLEDELLKLKRVHFFRVIERADILNRIGNFSILFIGIPDGLDPSLPVGSAKKGSFDEMYFNVYNYDGIEITKYEDDPASSRFNLPVLYQLQVIDIDNTERKQRPMTSVIVHYTRVVHLAEGSLSSSIEGMSSLEQPWNSLIDIEKIRGSSAEAYYRNARQKLSLETVDGASTGTMKPEEKEEFKKNVENFQDGLEDILRLNNMKANMLQPSMASPRDSNDIATENVSGTTGLPVRTLTGKASGVVTGSEDKATLNAFINDRQKQECAVYLLDALSIMNEAGILDLPEDAEVVWPVQSALGEKEKSESIRNKGQAFKDVSDGLSTIGADEVVAESVFKSVGLEGIEIDEINLMDGDEETNKDL